MSFKKLRGLLQRAGHPATPQAEAQVCIRQALKLLDGLENQRPLFDVTQFRRAVMWSARSDGSWVAYIDDLRLVVQPRVVHGQKMFVFKVGDDENTQFFADAGNAKENAEKAAGAS